MNYPNPQFPQQPQQQAWPQQPPQPQQQGFYPQQPPPGMPPVQAAPNPGQTAVGGQAAANLFVSFLNGPPKQRINRAKPDDGVHVVRFNNTCAVRFSQQSGQQFLLIEYTVLESTVPQMVSQTFGIPMFLSTRNQLEDLAEVCKVIFGQQGLQQLINTGRASPVAMAETVAGTMASGQVYCGLETRRSQSQIKKGTPYSEAYVNHYWTNASAQPFPLATLRQVPAQPPMQPTPPQALYAPPGTPPQLPQGYAQGQIPQQPAQPQQAWPQQPQQAPPPVQQAPQQAWPAQPPVQPQQQAFQPQQAPPPAVFVPPAAPGAFPGQR